MFELEADCLSFFSDRPIQTHDGSFMMSAFLRGYDTAMRHAKLEGKKP